MTKNMKMVQELIYTDISKNYSITGSALENYIYEVSGNDHWLYCPFIIRKENKSLVYAWKYTVDEKGTILGCHLFDRGENKEDFWQQAVMGDWQGLTEKHQELEGVFQQNVQLFIDSIFLKSITDIIKKYSLEVVEQESGFRLIVRLNFMEKVNYDIFYIRSDKKLRVNIFSPPI